MTTELENINFETLLTLDKNKMIIIIEYNAEKRKKIHQYIEQNYPTIKHIGLYSEYFPADCYATYIKCYYCDFRDVLINDYRYGTEANNRDESLSGTCPKCQERICFEPNYDDWEDVRRLHKHNMIVIGDYVKHANKPPHAKETNEKVEIDLKNNVIIEMICPEKLISHQKLQKFIDEEIGKNKLGQYTKR